MLSASLGFVTPSIIIITIIAKFLKNFSDFALVQHAFSGIRIGVCALVFYSVVKMIKKDANTRLKFSIFLVTFIAIGLLSISPILVVVCVGIFGVILGRRKKDA